MDQRHIDALVLLSEMQIRGQTPKLGALQRWVRECDAVLTPEMTEEEQDKVWRVLDSILRTTQPELIGGSARDGEWEQKKGSRLRWYAPFSADVPHPPALNSSSPTTLETISQASTVMKPLLTTIGPERRPPNKHPAIVYFSPPNTFPLAPSGKKDVSVKRFDVPGVPDTFVIHDVLTPEECDALVGAAEAVRS